MQTHQRTASILLSVGFACLIISPPSTSVAGDVRDALTVGWKGQKTCESLYDDDKIRILRCTMPPNGGHERHSHPPHFGYTLSGDGGRGRSTDPKGTQDWESKTDEYWVSDAIEWHEVINTGDTTQRYLVVEKKY